MVHLLSTAKNAKNRKASRNIPCILCYKPRLCSIFFNWAKAF